jgi:hypothetical protein
MQHGGTKTGRRGRVAQPLTGVLRREDRAEVDRQRVLGASRPLERLGEAQPHERQIRRELDRLAQSFDRVIEPPERGVRDAEVGQRDGIVGPHAARALEQRKRLRVAAALVRADRDEIERVDLARRFAQDLEEGLLGFEDASRVGEASRRVDARRDGRRSGSFSHLEKCR